jgi:hypothetical protein
MTRGAPAGCAGADVEEVVELEDVLDPLFVVCVEEDELAWCGLREWAPVDCDDEDVLLLDEALELVEFDVAALRLFWAVAPEAPEPSSGPPTVPPPSTTCSPLPGPA